MNPEQYVRALVTEGEALIAAAERDLEAKVPSCPEWTVSDLVRHTGNVHRHKRETVRRGGVARPTDLTWPPAPPSGAALAAWYREGVTLLANELAAADPEQPAWNWSGDHRVAFWLRRMAQETLVHRWDAEAATGAPGPVDPALAADGVDEFLTLWLPDEDSRYDGPQATVRLAATDTGDDWLVDLRDSPPMVRDNGERADVEITGSAADLLLTLWRRLAPDTLSVDGDRKVFLALLDAAEL